MSDAPRSQSLHGEGNRWVSQNSRKHVLSVGNSIIPRYPGTPPEYWGVRVPEWPDARQGDAQKIALVCERVRDYLKPE